MLQADSDPLDHPSVLQGKAERRFPTDLPGTTEHLRSVLCFRPSYEEEDPSASHPSFPQTPTRSDDVVPWQDFFPYFSCSF